MATNVGYLVIDASDPQRLAPFRCSLLDVTVEALALHVRPGG